MKHHRLLLNTKPAGLSQITGNGTSTNPYARESNFDTHLVIILAVLLCALVGALGLNSIVRFAIRCSRGEQAAGAAAAAGLKKGALRKIPVAVYGQGGSDSIIKATECPICLGDFAYGEKVRVLPKCKHGFHVRCIDTWLASHSSCPNCRHSLVEVSPATSPAVTEEGSVSRQVAVEAS